MVWSFSFDGLKRLFCYDACVLRRLWTATHASLVNNENMWPKFVYRRLTISLFDRNYDTVWAENIEKKIIETTIDRLSPWPLSLGISVRICVDLSMGFRRALYPFDNPWSLCP